MPWQRRPRRTPKPRVAPNVAGPVQWKTRRYSKGPSAADLPFVESSFWNINEEIREALQRVRGQCRTAYQQNDYFKRAVHLVRNSVVGNGVQFRLEGDDRTAQRTMDGWRSWGRRGICSTDGRYSWRQIEQMMMQSIAVNGEFIAIANYRGDHGFQLEVVDPIRLDPWFYGHGKSVRNNVVMGVEMDSRSKPMAYWFLKRNAPLRVLTSTREPGDMFRVRAENVLHVYDMEWAEQVRGMPAMVTILNRLSEIVQYEAAERTVARNQALMYHFLEHEQVGPYTTAEDEEPTEQELDLDTIGILRKGWKLNTIKPEHPMTSYEAFVNSNLRGVAAGAGVSFSDLASNFSEANFSSLRAERLTLKDEWRRFQQLVVEAEEWVFDRWVLQSSLRGMIPTRAADRKPMWTPRTWEHVQPREQARADKIYVDLGIKTRCEIIRDQGKNPEEVFKEAEAEITRLKEIGVIGPDMDNRQEGGDGVAGDRKQPKKPDLVLTKAAARRSEKT